MLRNITKVSWKHFFWHFNVSGCDIWGHVTRSLTSKTSWIVDWQHGGRQYESDVTVSHSQNAEAKKTFVGPVLGAVGAVNGGEKLDTFGGLGSRGLWGPHVAEDGMASVNMTAGARTG